MRVTSKGEYGLRALFDLAQRYGSNLVTSAEIAERQQVPEPYLNQLLLTLRKAGLVRSVRGPQGGYKLARPPGRITLAEAVVALEGDNYALVEGSNTTVAGSEPLEAAILRNVWHQVDTAVNKLLKSITLEDLCQRKLAHEERVMYYI